MAEPLKNKNLVVNIPTKGLDSPAILQDKQQFLMNMPIIHEKFCAVGRAK